MSFENWLNRKAEQNAHSEILAFSLMILGMNLLMGGLLVTIIVIGEPFFFPLTVQQPLSVSVALGPILTVVGFSVLSVGFILVIYYDKEKSWYINETKKFTFYQKRKTISKTANELLEELSKKDKETKRNL